MKRKLKRIESLVARLGKKKIKVLYFKEKYEEGFVGCAGDDHIWLSKTLLKKSLKEIEPYSTVFHELGHIYAKDALHINCAVSELRAQKWALRKAMELKYYKVYNDLIDEFHRWKRFKPTNHYRKAYDMAIKEGIIQ